MNNDHTFRRENTGYKTNDTELQLQKSHRVIHRIRYDTKVICAEKLTGKLLD